MNRIIYVNVWASPAVLEEIEVDIDSTKISYDKGLVYLDDKPHIVNLFGDERNVVIGVEPDEDGIPKVKTKWFDQEFLWMWEDLALLPVQTKETV